MQIVDILNQLGREEEWLFQNWNKLICPQDVYLGVS